MSLGSNLIKGAVAVGMMAVVGTSLQQMNNKQSTYNSNRAELKQLSANYQTELHRHPSKQVVTTNYQKALNVAKQYLSYSNAVHKYDQTKAGATSSARNTAVANMTKLMDNGQTSAGSLMPVPAKDWHTTISYGGQNSQSKIVMSYQMMDKANKLMMVVVFYYNVDSHKLSGFSTYDTNNSFKFLQEQGNKQG